MRIYKEDLKQIIKEEVLKEMDDLHHPVGRLPTKDMRVEAADVISMKERRALKLLRDTVAFKAGLERFYSDFKWLPEILDALEKSLGFQIFYLYHNDAFIKTIRNTINIIRNAPDSALPELLKLVAKDGKIVDTPPEPPVEIPEDPDELKALAIKTVVDQLDEIGRSIFSNEMHAAAIFKKKTDDEEKSFWQRRKQYDADTDYISDHKGESPFKELWQQLNVEAALN